MGKKRKGRDDGDDDDDYDDDGMPDMSRGSTSRLAPVSSVSAAQRPGVVGTTSPAAPLQSGVRWQQVLASLLDKILPGGGAGGVGSRSCCPFTREGLSEMCRADPNAYRVLLESSGFDLCVDPTSPHASGGHAPCTGHSFQRKQHLIQHCGPQPNGKTAAIGKSPPAANDDQAWRRYAPSEQLHYALHCKLLGQSELPPEQARERVPAQQASKQIAWPPMVQVTGLRQAEGGSQAMLKEKYSRWKPSRAYPVFDGSGFKGSAVLVFETDQLDQGFKAFENACSLENESRGNAQLVEWRTLQEWKQRNSKWADKLLRDAFEPRMLANEKARQTARVTELARAADEEKRKNATLAADHEKEVKRRKEQEERSELREAQWKAEHAEMDDQREAERRAAKLQITTLEGHLLDTRAQLQREQERQARVQTELVAAFGSEIAGVETRNLQLSEAQKVAEMRVRNTQSELAQFKSMVAQKEHQMREALAAQQADFERAKAEAAARAQTAAQAEEERRYEERRAQMLQALQEQMDEDRRTFEEKLQEKEKEVVKAKDEAESSPFGQGEYMKLVGDSHAFKQGQQVLEEAIIAEAELSGRLTEGRFRIFKPGELSKVFLKKQGMRLPKDDQNFTEAQLAVHYEVSNWQSVIHDAWESVDQSIQPMLKLDHAFVLEGGSYARIREHDEPEKEQKPCAATHCETTCPYDRCPAL